MAAANSVVKTFFGSFKSGGFSMELRRKARSTGPATMLRRSRRGTVMMVAMAFVVVVGLAGTVILSLSYAHQVQMQSKALSVRMMAAAEAGIESKRGRFTLISGVQDDWLALMPTAGWNNIDGPMVINGLSVQVQALPTGSFSVPKARMRGVVTTLGRRLAVEYEIKVASFSEFSVFSGGPGVYNPGTNYKTVGNHYSAGGLSFAYTGVEFWGRTRYTGAIGGPNYGQPIPTGPYFDRAPEPVPLIQVPADALNFGILQTRAQALNFVFRENTIAIRFNGNGTFTRTFVRRNNIGTSANNGTTPASNAWVTTGTTPATGGAIINANLTNAYYDVMTQDYAIQPETVIYVMEGTAGNNDVQSGAAVGVQNLYTQPFHQSTSYTTGWTSPTEATTARKLLLVSGTLGGSSPTVRDRVTLTAAGHIMPVVRDCVTYDTLLRDPTLRAQPNKQSAAALAMGEMFGLLSATDVNFATQWWNPLSTAGYTPAGGYLPAYTAATQVPLNGSGWGATNGTQYVFDGTYMAVGTSGPGWWADLWLELWLCGGNIGGYSCNAGFGNIFRGSRHYDWDWRMNDTTPPYFLRAYNVSAAYIPGSWRSYEF
jgi:hypothetical protein